MVVLNNKGLSRKTMASQNVPQKTTLKTILSQKTVHKHIDTTLQRLKIDSNKKPTDNSGVELLGFENF